MTKIKDLAAAVSSLRNAAGLLTDIADFLSHQTKAPPALETPAESQEPVQDTQTAPAEPTAPAEQIEPELTLEKVRGVLSDIARSGNREGVKSLLEKYGASKLSAIDPNDYAALLKDAEGLKNASLSRNSIGLGIAPLADVSAFCPSL